MANHSVTITAHIVPKSDTNSETIAVEQAQPEQSNSVEIADIPMAMPNNKAELVRLYQPEPLEINNSVQAKEMEKVAEQRVALYQNQLRRTEIFYTVKPILRPTYMVQTLKPQFVEYQHYQMGGALD